MFRLQVWLGVAWLAVACSDRGADRPDGRRDSGTERSLPDGGSLLGGIGPLGETSWTPLLDDSLSLFYRWMPSKGRDKDPQGVFAMDGGELHVLGIPATDQQQDYGYLATLADIGDYRARAEQ